MAINLNDFNAPPSIDTINLELANGQHTTIDILRLDQIHDKISGNKWYKLKYNLQKASRLGASGIVSFGGAYSNHLHALAYAGKKRSIKTIGIVRGEAITNPTLKDCQEWGMKLQFVSRAAYRKKNEAPFLNELKSQYTNHYFVPEGGDNELGVKGCKEMLQTINHTNYELLCCSIGTGTTITGISQVFKNKIWGFAPFKNAHSLKKKLENHIPPLKFIDQYHLGGFGKNHPDLEQYMAQFKTAHNIALDKIYTGKMFYGLKQELSQISQIPNKILVIHTGGLQGNRSGNS